MTELVEARIAAQTSLDNMEMLQNFAGVGYWEVDLEANTVHWSEKVYEIHRTTAAEFTPNLENGIDFYHPDDRQEVSDHVARVRKDGGEFHFEKRLLCADESVVTVESHGVAIRDENGKVAKITGFFREIANGS